MIKENIAQIRARIASVCANVGRDTAGITLIAVSKTRAPGQMQEAVASGITDIGESRVQEAVSKIYAMPYALCALRIHWHLIGHLQTNKARQAVKFFDLIHSVDSLRLAEEINKQAAKINKIQDILLEVKTAPEATKFGFKPEDVLDAAKRIVELKSVCLKGLMTIAPIVDNPEDARQYFRKTKDLLYSLNAMPYVLCPMQVLSMGMTDDFEMALEEGATMIRIGRAIFEPS